jgi:adenylate cyclase
MPAGEAVKRYDELRSYERALETYRRGETKKAYDLFQTLEEEHGSKLYRLYLQRCQEYLEHPQKPFDAIYTMLVK